MSTPAPIVIPCQPANPVDYLACCGLADLLARLDPGARTHWRTAAPLAFVMESTVSEAEFLATLLATFRDISRWKFIRAPRTDEPARIDVEFSPEGRPPFIVPLDWWYETLNDSGEIAEKSAWKMYAANQTMKGTTESLISHALITAPPATLEATLKTHIPMTGRFGFDPRSSKDALNAGFSPNDLKQPVNTYPFAELLALFGANLFFPSRCGRAGQLNSTRGWNGREGEHSGFTYMLWKTPLPVLLARSVGRMEVQTHPVTFFSRRSWRGQFSNLTFSNPNT